MNAARLIGLALQVSIVLLVFCVGLNAPAGDVRWLLRRPGLVARSLLAMNVILPVIAASIAVLLRLPAATTLALIALAVSPVPPILPSKQIKAGGTASYAVGLLALSALLAVLFVPLDVNALARLFGREVSVAPATVAGLVAQTVLVPLLLGMGLRFAAPAFAQHLSPPLSVGATVLMLAAFVPVVVVAWPKLMAQVGNFTLVAIVLLTVIGLAVGHALGGPDGGDRTVLALSTATRHPGVAVAVARAGAPDDPSVVATVFLAFLVGMLVTVPYVKWRKRVPGGAVAA
ncbi:MAG TPA: hypothetical protein VFV75_05850 [Candidatus Polarisedimenticolaceae bacterium]|nr:hypothetical protein [Candidatus Polarisedimenticolaceae bacterium]